MYKTNSVFYFNTFVDMMQQKLSTMADFGKTEHRENDG